MPSSQGNCSCACCSFRRLVTPFWMNIFKRNKELKGKSHRSLNSQCRCCYSREIHLLRQLTVISSLLGERMARWVCAPLGTMHQALLVLFA